MSAEVEANTEEIKKLKFRRYEPNEETRKALFEFHEWVYFNKIDPENEFNSIEEAIDRVLGSSDIDDDEANRQLNEAITEDKDGFIETVYLNSVPSLAESIIEAMNTPLEECIDESEVEW